MKLEHPPAKHSRISIPSRAYQPFPSGTGTCGKLSRSEEATFDAELSITARARGSPLTRRTLFATSVREVLQPQPPRVTLVTTYLHTVVCTRPPTSSWADCTIRITHPMTTISTLTPTIVVKPTIRNSPTRKILTSSRLRLLLQPMPIPPRMMMSRYNLAIVDFSPPSLSSRSGDERRHLRLYSES